jgi:hypothetical protein
MNGTEGIAHATTQARDRVRLSGVTYRAIVIAVMAASALAVHLVVTPWSAAPSMEPELLRLLRGMVLIKAGIGAAVAGFVLWRLADGIDRDSAVAYAIGVAALAASLAWLWSLVLVPVASLLFYASVVALVVIAHRDRSLFAYLDPRGRARR